VERGALAPLLWLRFRPAGSGTDDSTSSGNETCVDSGLASFCTFCGARHSSCVGSLHSGSPSPQPPAATRRSPLVPDSLATGHSDLTRHSPLRLRWVPEASSRRFAHHHTHPTSPRIRHPHPASVVCHLTFAIRHLTFAIRHLPAVIRVFFLPIPHSAFSEGFPAFAAALGAGRTVSGGAARMPGCNPAPRGRTARRPRLPRFPHARPPAPGAGRRAAR